METMAKMQGIAGRHWFVPVFFVVVRGFFKGSERQRKIYAHELEEGKQ